MKRCGVDGCKTTPSQGFAVGKGLRCVQHKEPGMEDLKKTNLKAGGKACDMEDVQPAKETWAMCTARARTMGVTELRALRVEVWRDIERRWHPGSSLVYAGTVWQLRKVVHEIDRLIRESMMSHAQ